MRCEITLKSYVDGRMLTLENVINVKLQQKYIQACGC